MNILNTVLEAFEQVTGLPQSELKDICDLDLFENDIIDSLSLAELMTLLEKKTEHAIDIKTIRAGNFSTINGIVAILEKY